MKTHCCKNINCWKLLILGSCILRGYYNMKLNYRQFMIQSCASHDVVCESLFFFLPVLRRSLTLSVSSWNPDGFCVFILFSQRLLSRNICNSLGIVMDEIFRGPQLLLIENGIRTTKWLYVYISTDRRNACLARERLTDNTLGEKQTWEWLSPCCYGCWWWWWWERLVSRDTVLYKHIIALLYCSLHVTFTFSVV